MGVKKLPMNGEGGGEGRGESVFRPCSFGKRHYVCFQKGLFSLPRVYTGKEQCHMCEIEREGERIIAKYSYECPSSYICMV